MMSSASDFNDVAGASGDLSRVVLESDEHKMPLRPLPLCDSGQEKEVVKQEKEDRRSNDLYEWSAGRQCLVLVNAASEAEGGALVSVCGAVLGQGPERDGGTHGAVSEDGSRIFFTAPDPSVEGSHCWTQPGGPNAANEAYAPQVYMRANGESPVKVSAPAQGVSPPVTYPAVFVGASGDGSRVFFVSRTELTKQAVELGTQGLELYEYNVNGSEEAANWWEKKLVLVSAGAKEEVDGAVTSVPAVSADGSRVYFNGAGELTPGVGGGLYRFDTGTGETTRVAPAAGYPAHEPITWFQSPFISPGEDGLDVHANYYTTRDGRFLMFGSSAKVTGYDSNGQSELYRYDADLPVSEGGGVQENPVCVSCNQNGVAPLVGSEFDRSAFIGGNPAGTPPRPISEDGQYVFFDTAELLVPLATNGKVDVYEWEADGAGSCKEPKGCVSLIGSGQDPTSSFFLDSSEDGSNMFLGTHVQLVTRDTDTEGDLYDARKGGGEAVHAGTGPCEGDACDNPPAGPVFQTPASFTFSGAGNLSETPPPPKPIVGCPKGKKLSHGKCVKSKPRKPKHKNRSKGKRR